MFDFNKYEFPERFLITDLDGIPKGFELHKVVGIKPNANLFCAIPYQNYFKKKIDISYFELLNEEEIIYNSETVLLPEIKFVLKTTKQNYIEKVIALKNEIKLGNVYEINYCIEFFAEAKNLNVLQVFKNLAGISKAPYCQLFKINDEVVISASPELFLKREGNKLFTKPIKGTIKRSTDLVEDINLKNQLFNNLKDRTENVMAVDVARNDLSVIAKRGTVEVNELYKIESFENVHQMVSTVGCELKDGITFEEIIAATFPMASMTGAPKISAMNLIDEYEDFERNYYSATAGIIAANGDFELPVLIRSIFYNTKTNLVSICVGGAITRLSNPEEEWEECILKAKNMLLAINGRIDWAKT